MSVRRVIINADDFGLDAEVNEIILDAFRLGTVSSATLMANMPAFADACTSVVQQGLQGRVGLHFNLTHGQPLTDAMCEQALFYRAGQLDLHLSRRALSLPADVQRAVFAELQAQWQRCLDHGVRPSHIDSHQHVHNLWPIGPLVAAFAGQQQVPVRPARNLGRNIGLLKRGYKALLNHRIRQRCSATVNQVCTPRDLLDGLEPGPLLEVVAHPRRLADGRLGDDYLPDDQPLEEVLQRCLDRYQRISYSELQ